MQMDAIELESWNYGYCLPSLIATKQEDYEVCKSFDFGSSLQNVYPLLRFVFKYLMYTDLESAGKVNDTWGKYAVEELAKRNGPSWMRLTKVQTARFILERSVNFMYDEVTFSLVFHENVGKNLWTSYRLNNFNDMEQYQQFSFEDYFTLEALPEGKEFWTFSCEYVSHSNMLSPNKFDTQFSILSIPSIPHVAIRRYIFTKTKPPNIRNILDENLQSDEIIDCLLVFGWPGLEVYVEAVVCEILMRQGANTIALGGGMTDSLNLFNHRNPSDRLYARCVDMCCIAFTRKRHMQVDFGAFSLVITEGDDFEAKVSDFRRRMLLRKNSFMIRVCSAAKDQTEKETPLIHKYFPRTPITGFLSSNYYKSQIGWNRLPQSKDKCRDANDNTLKKIKVFPKTYHRNSTVLVLITWGPEV